MVWIQQVDSRSLVQIHTLNTHNTQTEIGACISCQMVIITQYTSTLHWNPACSYYLKTYVSCTDGDQRTDWYGNWVSVRLGWSPPDIILDTRKNLYFSNLHFPTSAATPYFLTSHIFAQQHLTSQFVKLADSHATTCPPHVSLITRVFLHDVNKVGIDLNK